MTEHNETDVPVCTKHKLDCHMAIIGGKPCICNADKPTPEEIAEIRELNRMCSGATAKAMDESDKPTTPAPTEPYEGHDKLQAMIKAQETAIGFSSDSPAPTEHRPECAVNELAVGEPTYGVNVCTCDASTPPAPTAGQVREAREFLKRAARNHDRALYSPDHPQARLASMYRTILAALEQAQEDAFALSAMHCEHAKAGDGGYITCALRADLLSEQNKNARLVEAVTERHARVVQLYTGNAKANERNAAQADQIRDLNEQIKRLEKQLAGDMGRCREKGVCALCIQQCLAQSERKG